MSTSKKKSTTRAAKPAAQMNPENLPAVVATGSLSLPEGFKVKRNLQMPSLVMKKPGEQRILLFSSGLQVSTVKSKPGEAPATVADVTDFQTGEIFKFLVPSVVESSLVQTFGPADAQLPSGAERMEKGADDRRRAVYGETPIVGKLFAIRNAGKREGKRHVDFEVVELEAPTVTPAK